MTLTWSFATGFINQPLTSISEGLPKEIELRQKQYEYYRDMLLTFPSLRAKGEAIQK